MEVIKMDFKGLFQELLSLLEEIKKEAEKHRFEVTKLTVTPFSIEFRCSRVATNETIFYLEFKRLDNGQVDIKMKDKNGNYL